ncbi:MAG TPA: cupin domain-containing protein [Thermomicrobiales bacterium]|nr:cupin domain-containing protein [Thermomicrobiales bacterium]
MTQSEMKSMSMLELSSVKRVRLDRAAAAPSPSPVFLGPVRTQKLIADGDAESLRVTAVTFEDGARNRWHMHTTDQLLVVTDGRGVVATEEQEMQVAAGDVVLIPAGCRHWHGAEPGQTFTHIAILAPGEMTIDE